MAVKVRTGQIGSGTVNLPFLGMALAKEPKVLQEFISAYAPSLPLTTLLQAISPESQNEEVIGNNQVKWQVHGAPVKISRVERYEVPGGGNPVVGGRLKVVVNDGWFRHGAKFTLFDDRSQLYCDSDGEPTSDGIVYSFQVIGGTKGTPLDVALLAKGMPLNYNTASYEEGSKTGHPIYFGTGDWYFNAMETTRHKFQITGDALTQAILYEDTKVENGQEKKYAAWLPNVIDNSGRNLIQFHLRAKEINYIKARRSYDPTTGEVFLKAGHNGNEDVLIGDGLRAQLEDAYTVFYDPLVDSPAYIRWSIRAIISYLSYHWDQDYIDLIIMGGRGARMIFSDAMREELNANTVTTFMTPDKENRIAPGLIFDSIKTDFGTAKFVLNNCFDDPSVETQQITYQGLRLSASSFEMYFMPLKRMPSGQLNIRLYSKGKTAWGQEINRSLVFGHIQGMTGFMQGKGATSKTIDAMVDYGRLVSTGQDSEQLEVLSQTMLIITDPSRFARLIPYPTFN